MSNFLNLNVTKVGGATVTPYSQLFNPAKMSDITLNNTSDGVKFLYPLKKAQVLEVVETDTYTTIADIMEASNGAVGSWGEITGTLSSQTDLQSALDLKLDELVSISSQTDDYVLALSDQNKVVDVSKATAVSLTVPPNTDIAFPVGSIIYVRRTGVGTLTIVEGSGVTVTGSSGGLTDPGLNVMMTLHKTGTNTWDLQNGIPGTLQDWTPSFTGFSVNPTVSHAKYLLIGKCCICMLGLSANGTSNATTFTITLPFAASNTTVQRLPVNVADNGVTPAIPGKLNTRVNSNIADVYKDWASAAFTASGAKGVSFTITYFIE